MYQRPEPLQRKYSVHSSQLERKSLPVNSSSTTKKIQQSLPPIPTVSSNIPISGPTFDATNDLAGRRRRLASFKRAAIITTLPHSSSVDAFDNSTKFQQHRLTHSNSEDIDESDDGQPAPLLRDVIFQLRRYSDNWFKEVARKHPEIFVDSTNYALYARNQRRRN